MPKCKACPVELPHLTPRVWLSPELAETLELIIGAGLTGINSWRLMDAGILHPDIKIAELKEGGAVIYVEKRRATTSCGLGSGNVSHYTYKGWI
jgi:hypothetical protein